MEMNFCSTAIPSRLVATISAQTTLPIAAICRNHPVAFSNRNFYGICVSDENVQWNMSQDALMES